MLLVERVSRDYDRAFLSLQQSISGALCKVLAVVLSQRVRTKLSIHNMPGELPEVWQPCLICLIHLLSNLRDKLFDHYLVVRQ
jgi:hypothetical protein